MKVKIIIIFQAVDQFGNTIANAQQSLAGVVNQQTAGTGSSMGGVGGYGENESHAHIQHYNQNLYQYHADTVLESILISSSF